MQIQHRDRLLPQEEVAVTEGFIAYNAQKGQVSVRAPVAFAVYNGQGHLQGALDGYMFFDYLTISRLWVAESARGNGIGNELMAAAEALAGAKGCTGSTLSTYDFQAKFFYSRLGYEVFGVLEDNPRGHVRFFMRKDL